MTSRLVRWMRLVLPNSAFAWGWVFGEILIELTYLTTVWCGWLPDETFFRNARLGWLGAGMAIFGASRVIQFHPALNEQYRHWLDTTPWTAEKALPGGPLSLALQDVIVVAAVMALSREMSELVLIVPLAFLVGYQVTLAASARLCDDWIAAYLLAFGLGLVALLCRSLSASLVAAVACCPLSLIAVQRSLKRFPWSFDSRKLTRLTKPAQEEISNDRLGWPHDYMSPRIPQVWLPLPDGICLSLLAGWVTFIAHYHALGGFKMFVSVIALQFVGICIVARLASYAKAHRSPIDLLGRLRQFRLIVPGYDVIFVAPLIAGIIQFLAQAIAIRLLLDKFGRLGPVNNQTVWIAVGISVAGVTFSLLVLTTMGPRLEQWRLSGQHRIVFDATNKQAAAAFVEL